MARGDDIRTGLNQARRFGGSVGGAFLVLAALGWWWGHALLAAVLALPAVVLLILALLAPLSLLPVERLWMRGAHAISRVTTPIVMGIVYLVVITPIGLLVRWLRGDPLRHAGPDGSCWVPRDRDADRRGDLTRQF